MKRILFIIVVIFGFTACNKDKEEHLHSKQTCLKEYKEFNKTIYKYKIRLEESIKQNGCISIPIYASIIKTKQFELLDKIDEDPNIVNRLAKLLSINRDIFDLILENANFKKIILENSLNKQFIDRLSYLIQKKLYKNSNIDYAVLASLYAKDNKESIYFYNELKNSISKDILPSFNLLFSSVKDEYKFSSIVEIFKTLEKGLSDDGIKLLVNYPQYLAYFLYVKKEALDIYILPNSELREIQKRIQKEVIYIYNTMFNKYRYKNGIEHNDYALLSIRYIYPYLLTQYKISFEDFKLLFSKLIDKDYIINLFQKDICSQNTKNRFAVFGNNNIINGIKLLKKEKKLSRELFYNFKDPNYSIMSFFYIANLYQKLSNKEWTIFKHLLKELPFDYDNKIAFIQKIEKAGYFRNIANQNDINQIINSEYCETNPKYKYVLLTPYPSQNDMSIFDRVLETNIKNRELQISLSDLISKNKNELEIHEFTMSEKIFGKIDKLDDILTVASIALMPFTGGLSLNYVASKVATKKASKKGVKYFMKKIIVNSKKIYRAIDNTSKVTNLISVGRDSYLYLNSENYEQKTICKE